MSELRLLPIEPTPSIDNRDSLIEWLQWNDPNGSYSDYESDRDELPRLTLEEAISCYFDQKGA